MTNYQHRLGTDKYTLNSTNDTTTRTLKHCGSLRRVTLVGRGAVQHHHTPRPVMRTLQTLRSLSDHQPVRAGGCAAWGIWPRCRQGRTSTPWPGHKGLPPTVNLLRRTPEVIRARRVHARSTLAAGVKDPLAAAVDAEAAAVWQWFCRALPPRLGWSTMVSVPVSLAGDTSTCRSRPMMRRSWMWARQTLCTISWSPMQMCTAFVPSMLASSPITAVGVHAAESTPMVPCRTPGRTSVMLDPVSTRARHAWPSSSQFTKSPRVWPRRPTRVESVLEGRWGRPWVP